MSIESAKAFIEKMKNDEEFAKKIMAETNQEARMALACGEGFAFTKDEIGQVEGELTDEELDMVAGGLHKSWWSMTPPMSARIPLQP